MRATRRNLIGVAVVAAVVGISVAAPAAADLSNDCQSAQGVTVCAQGGVSSIGGGQTSVPGGGIPPYGGGECATQYGTYQNCLIRDGVGRGHL
jgi:hypothetical protein